MPKLRARGLVPVPTNSVGTYGKLEAKPVEGKAFSIAHTCGDVTLLPRFLPQLRGLVNQREHAKGEHKFIGELLPYQKIAVDDCMTTMIGHGGLLLRADCGTGKTVMSLALACRLGIRRIVILVDQANIAEQWSERIKTFLGEDATLFSGDGESIADARTASGNIKIIMAQSLMRQDWATDPMQTDLLIVDEAHVFSAPIFSGAMRNIDFAYSVGLTATPDRKDKLEWLFKAILGDAEVHVKAKARIAKVRGVFLDMLPDVSSDDYQFFWCKINRSTTWAAKCTGCHLYGSYPNCGGVQRLQKDRVNMAALVSLLANDPEYNKWIIDSCDQLLASGRHVLIFSQLRKHLKDLYQTACERFGEQNCGLYIGVQVKDDETRRKVAMDRKLTFCTFGVANKALDVPHKDTAIFTTPKSDVRQAKGRIERPLVNKKDPVIIDPVLAHIDLFKYMWFARRRIYRESGSEISTIEL